MLRPCLSAEVDVGRDQEFTVNTRGAGGQGQLDVRITSPSRRPIPCKVETGTGDARPVQYMPPEEGPYKVEVAYDGHPVPGSPFAVEAVMPPDPSKVSVGPGGVGGRGRLSWGPASCMHLCNHLLCMHLCNHPCTFAQA